MATGPVDATDMLAREFLIVRARLLEVAASLDRVTRSEGSVDDDPLMKQICQALHLIADAKSDRAEQFQMLFSLPYDERWRQEYDIAPPA